MLVYSELGKSRGKRKHGRSKYTVTRHNCSPPCEVAVYNSAFPGFCKNYCCKTIEATNMKKNQMKANRFRQLTYVLSVVFLYQSF